MNAGEKSRFEEIRKLIREVEARTEQRIDRKAEEWERRFEWLIKENAALRTEVERMKTRCRTPDAWTEDTDEDRRSA